MGSLIRSVRTVTFSQNEESEGPSSRPNSSAKGTNQTEFGGNV